MRTIIGISGTLALALAAGPSAAAGAENGFWWVTPENGNGYATVQGGYLVGDNVFDAHLCGRMVGGQYNGFEECGSWVHLALSDGEYTGWYFPQTLLYLGCGPGGTNLNWSTTFAEIMDFTTGNLVRVNLASSYTTDPEFSMGCPAP